MNESGAKEKEEEEEMDMEKDRIGMFTLDVLEEISTNSRRAEDLSKCSRT